MAGRHDFRSDLQYARPLFFLRTTPMQHPFNSFFVRLGGVSSSRPDHSQDAARSRGQGWPQATASSRREASLTVASTASQSRKAGRSKVCTNCASSIGPRARRNRGPDLLNFLAGKRSPNVAHSMQQRHGLTPSNTSFAGWHDATMKCSYPIGGFQSHIQRNTRLSCIEYGRWMWSQDADDTPLPDRNDTFPGFRMRRCAAG